MKKPNRRLNSDLLAKAIVSELRRLGWKAVTEHRFHPKRRWRFDVAVPEAKVALEIEGGVFGHGRPCPVCHRRAPGAHASAAGIQRDIEKYNEALHLGWRVFRVMPRDALGQGLDDLKAALAE